MDLPRKGDFIDHVLPVTLITTFSPDRRQLLDLDRQHANASERAALASKHLTELTAVDSDLEKRMQAYRTGMISRVEHEIAEADAESTGCLAEVQQRREVGARMEELNKRGFTSRIRSAEALALQEAAVTKCSMAGARLRGLRAELLSVQNGVILRDAASDVSSQQQRDRLVLRRQELKAEEQQESSQAQQFEEQIAEERGRIDRLGKYEMTLPKDHVVWAVPASPGSAVTEGQIILDLANCRERFVAVELPERAFEQIKAGDPASVRLIGSDQWHAGEVRRVQGSAARADDRLLAAQIPRPPAGNIAVEVSLTDAEGPAEQNSFCNIGRLAEVRFQRPHPPLLDRLDNLVGRLTQSLTIDRPAEKVGRQ
jgi:multidrug resistance efflux pump